MQPYRLMLVDDEEYLRQGVIRRIDWDACGFTVVGEAENGQAGLELAERLQPDVILTDIKMPFMDGLTMSRRVLETQPGVKIIMLSGFDDFEYAQEAIALGSMDYILKPIDAAELTETLMRVRDRLDVEMREKRNVARLREHYVRSLPILREQLLHRLLDKRVDAADLTEQAAQMELDLAASRYVVAYVRADIPAGTPDRDAALIPLSVRELVEGQLKEGFRFQCVQRGSNVCAIGLLDEPAALPGFLTALGRVCYLGQHFYGLRVSAGVGLPVASAGDIYQSAQGAREALDSHAFLDDGPVLYIQDIVPDPGARFVFDDSAARELISAIRLGQEARIYPLAEQAVALCRGARIPVALHRFYIMSVLTELVKLMQAHQIPVEAVLAGDCSADSLASSLSPDELIRRLAAICTDISRRIRSSRTDLSRTLAERARAFLDSRYADPTLSVDRLCEHLHVSPSYFSTVFKRETGETFVSYLTKVRMERAAELLRTTDAKPYIIAEKVGITEANYFSYVFKKHFGVAPSKFRETSL